MANNYTFNYSDEKLSNQYNQLEPFDEYLGNNKYMLHWALDKYISDELGGDTFESILKIKNFLNNAQYQNDLFQLLNQETQNQIKKWYENIFTNYQSDFHLKYIQNMYNTNFKPFTTSDPRKKIYFAIREKNKNDFISEIRKIKNKSYFNYNYYQDTGKSGHAFYMPLSFEKHATGLIIEDIPNDNETKIIRLYNTGHGTPFEMNTFFETPCYFEGTFKPGDLIGIFTNVKNLYEPHSYQPNMYVRNDYDLIYDDIISLKEFLGNDYDSKIEILLFFMVFNLNIQPKIITLESYFLNKKNDNIQILKDYTEADGTNAYSLESQKMLNHLSKIVISKNFKTTYENLYDYLEMSLSTIKPKLSDYSPDVFIKTQIAGNCTLRASLLPLVSIIGKDNYVKLFANGKKVIMNILLEMLDDKIKDNITFNDSQLLRNFVEIFNDNLDIVDNIKFRSLIEKFLNIKKVEIKYQPNLLNDPKIPLNLIQNEPVRYRTNDGKNLDFISIYNFYNNVYNTIKFSYNLLTVYEKSFMNIFMFNKIIEKIITECYLNSDITVRDKNRKLLLANLSLEILVKMINTYSTICIKNCYGNLNLTMLGLIIIFLNLTNYQNDPSVDKDSVEIDLSKIIYENYYNLDYGNKLCDYVKKNYYSFFNISIQKILKDKLINEIKKILPNLDNHFNLFVPETNFYKENITYEKIADTLIHINPFENGYEKIIYINNNKDSLSNYDRKQIINSYVEFYKLTSRLYFNYNYNPTLPNSTPEETKDFNDKFAKIFEIYEIFAKLSYNNDIRNLYNYYRFNKIILENNIYQKIAYLISGSPYSQNNFRVFFDINFLINVGSSGYNNSNILDNYIYNPEENINYILSIGKQKNKITEISLENQSYSEPLGMSYIKNDVQENHKKNLINNIIKNKESLIIQFLFIKKEGVFDILNNFKDINQSLLNCFNNNFEVNKNFVFANNKNDYTKSIIQEFIITDLLYNKKTNEIIDDDTKLPKISATIEYNEIIYRDYLLLSYCVNSKFEEFLELLKTPFRIATNYVSSYINPKQIIPILNATNNNRFINYEYKKIENNNTELSKLDQNKTKTVLYFEYFIPNLEVCFNFPNQTYLHCKYPYITLNYFWERIGNDWLGKCRNSDNFFSKDLILKNGEIYYENQFRLLHPFEYEDLQTIVKFIWRFDSIYNVLTFNEVQTNKYVLYFINYNIKFTYDEVSDTFKYNDYDIVEPKFYLFKGIKNCLYLEKDHGKDIQIILMNDTHYKPYLDVYNFENNSIHKFYSNKIKDIIPNRENKYYIFDISLDKKTIKCDYETFVKLIYSSCINNNINCLYLLRNIISNYFNSPGNLFNNEYYEYLLTFNNAFNKYFLLRDKIDLLKSNEQKIQRIENDIEYIKNVKFYEYTYNKYNLDNPKPVIPQINLPLISPITIHSHIPPKQEIIFDYSKSEYQQKFLELNTCLNEYRTSQEEKIKITESAPLKPQEIKIQMDEIFDTFFLGEIQYPNYNLINKRINDIININYTNYKNLPINFKNEVLLYSNTIELLKQNNDFIIFAGIKNIIPYNYQLKFIKDLNFDDPFQIKQLIMGAGKTDVITPMKILEIFGTKDVPIVICLPENLVPQTYDIIMNSIGLYFDYPIELLKIDRNFGIKTNLPKTLLPKSIYIMSDTSLKCSILNQIDINGIYIKNLSDTYFIFDEYDSLSNPLSDELNYPESGDRKDITYEYKTPLFNFIQELCVDGKIWLQETYKKTFNPVKRTNWIFQKEEYDSEELYKLLRNYYELFKEELRIKTSKSINYDNDYSLFVNKIGILFDKIYKQDFGLLKPEKLPNQNIDNFIKNNKKYIVAIPFDKTVPIEKSEFQSMEITLLFSILSYYLEGLQEYDFFVLNHFITKEITLDSVPNPLLKLSPEFQILSIIQEYRKEPKGAIEKYKMDKILINYYLTKIVEKFIFVYPNIKNISFNEVIMKSYSRIGFTGTPSGLYPLLYPNEIKGKSKEFVEKYLFENKNIIIRKEDEGATLNALLDDQGYGVEFVDNFEIPDNIGEYTCLIDVGGYYIDKTPLQMAFLLKEKIKKDIIYIDKGVKYILPRDSLIPINYVKKVYDNSFVYYDQSSITGQDIPMPDNAKGLCTVTFKTIYRDLAQGAFRLRKLNRGEKGQHLILLINCEVINKLLNTTKIVQFDSIEAVNAAKIAIKPIDVIKMCYLNNIINENKLQKEFIEQTIKALNRINSTMITISKIPWLYINRPISDYRYIRDDPFPILFNVYDSLQSGKNTVQINQAIQTNIQININININQNINITVQTSALPSYDPFTKFNLFTAIDYMPKIMQDSLMYNGFVKFVNNNIKIYTLTPNPGFNNFNKTFLLIKDKTDNYTFILTDYKTKYQIISDNITNKKYSIINFSYNGEVLRKDFKDIDINLFYIYLHIKYNLIGQENPSRWEIWKLTMNFNKSKIPKEISDLLFATGSRISQYSSLIPDSLLFTNEVIKPDALQQDISNDIKTKYYQYNTSTEFLSNGVYDQIANSWLTFYNEKIKGKKILLQLIQYPEEAYP